MNLKKYVRVWCPVRHCDPKEGLLDRRDFVIDDVGEPAVAHAVAVHDDAVGIAVVELEE